MLAVLPFCLDSMSVSAINVLSWFFSSLFTFVWSSGNHTWDLKTPGYWVERALQNFLFLFLNSSHEANGMVVKLPNLPMIVFYNIKGAYIVLVLLMLMRALGGVDLLQSYYPKLWHFLYEFLEPKPKVLCYRLLCSFKKGSLHNYFLIFFWLRISPNNFIPIEAIEGLLSVL